MDMKLWLPKCVAHKGFLWHFSILESSFCCIVCNDKVDSITGTNLVSNLIDLARLN
jgi:hypothetical protein